MVRNYIQYTIMRAWDWMGYNGYGLLGWGWCMDGGMDGLAFLCLLYSMTRLVSIQNGRLKDSFFTVFLTSLSFVGREEKV